MCRRTGPLPKRALRRMSSESEKYKFDKRENRADYAEAEEISRKDLKIEERKRDAANRSIQAEGTFGDIKENFGYGQIRRRQDSIRIEIGFVVLSHNLRAYRNQSRKWRKKRKDFHNPYTKRAKPFVKKTEEEADCFYDTQKEVKIEDFVSENLSIPVTRHGSLFSNNIKNNFNIFQ